MPILTKPSYLKTAHSVLALGVLAVTGLVAVGMLRNHYSPTPAKHGGRPNPWRGLPGCLWVGNSLWPVAAGDRLGCGPNAQILPEGAQPGHSTALLNALQPMLAAPPHAQPGTPTLTKTKADPAASPRLNQLNDRAVLQGSAVTLTLQPQAQRQANAVVNCMTGYVADCPSAGIDGQRWAHHYEGAATRMAALVQIDLASGGIDVLASGHSPCFASDAQASSGPDCPRLSYAPRQAALWRLDNHALYTYVLPGSIVKPVMALALLRSDIAASLSQEPGRNWLLRTLKESDTPALLDKLYCKDSGFAADCPRPQLLPQAATDLGFNGPRLATLMPASKALQLPSARIFQQLSQPAAGMAASWQAMPMRDTPSSLRAQCSANGWGDCKNQFLAAQIAEQWGAGDANTSPLAMASVLARLGAAANGTARFAPPHLLSSVETGDGLQKITEKTTGMALAHNQDTAHARLITAGMGLSHTSANYGVKGSKAGTAHSACLAVYGTAANCNAISWLAGKTGTPGMKGQDALPFFQRTARCDAAREAQNKALAQGLLAHSAIKTEVNNCNLRPYKWYVALIKDSSESTTYSKAICVLVERNYLRSSGHVDAANDEGSPNMAAELALRYLKAVRASSGSK